MKLLSLFVLSSMFTASFVSAAPASEREAIRSMKGCYEVRFHFIETFVSRADYPVHSPEYQERGLEWVDLDLDSDNKIALQHILIAPEGVQKHWRQEWTYEPASIQQFQGLNTWTVSALDPVSTKGMWSQRVTQVDDSPRYDCVAPWVQWTDTNGLNHQYWECQSFAPLPRREFSQRSDYQILNRRNRQEITAAGWLHEQDNSKLQFTREGDLTSPTTEIAREKGLDTYTRVSDERCLAAQTWWTQNKGIWHEIESMWIHVQSHHLSFRLADKINGKTLWMRLFELAESATQLQQNGTPMTGDEIQMQAHEIIHEYMTVL